MPKIHSTVKKMKSTQQNTIPKTELELALWMKTNCFNFNSYSIGGNPIHEGCGIEKSGSLYIWYYTEKGEWQNLDYFRTEEEIVKFAHDKILNDKWANNHCIGFTTNKSKSTELTNILKQRKIEYMADEIPYYGAEQPVFRVFVFGCDHRQTNDLKSKYYEKKNWL